jgi:hypothetical protein
MTLTEISRIYSAVEHNADNFGIGGGLSNDKFASRRHEDARTDTGKMTLGEATSLIKRATNLPTAQVKEVLKFALPNMEWHHAGTLPKNYGGGMKKTFFVKAAEIAQIAAEWDTLYVRWQRYKDNAATAPQMDTQRTFADLRSDYLKEHAVFVERVNPRPDCFVQLKREQCGKFGWFDSSKRAYNLPEYFTGWVFASVERYVEYLRMK